MNCCHNYVSTMTDKLSASYRKSCFKMSLTSAEMSTVPFLGHSMLILDVLHSGRYGHFDWSDDKGCARKCTGCLGFFMCASVAFQLTSSFDLFRGFNWIKYEQRRKDRLLFFCCLQPCQRLYLEKFCYTQMKQNTKSYAENTIKMEIIKK